MKPIATLSASEHTSSLSNLLVSEIMRKRVVALSPESDLEKAISAFIKYKVNAILILDQSHQPQGVLSKTEVIGAYYASFSLQTPIGNIMTSPVYTCYPDDTLTEALSSMQEKKVHRLYVLNKMTQQATGTLAYPDIVGRLYRFCHNCELSRLGPRRINKETTSSEKLRVADLMTATVKAVQASDMLGTVIEELFMHRFGAFLVRDGKYPAGVISKTDLIIAFKRGMSFEESAQTIMSSPVAACNQKELLEKGIHRMIFSEISRLFVYSENPENIIGVLSLSDAARARSGSCLACTNSRITVES